MIEDSTQEPASSAQDPSEGEVAKLMKNKVFRFGCLPILVILLIRVLVGGGDDNPEAPPVEMAEMVLELDPLGIGIDSVNALVGNPVPYHLWERWGFPNTLPGSNGQYWLVYLDSANVSFVADKSTEIILFAAFGENSARYHLEALDKRRREHLQQQFSAWDGSHRELNKAIKAMMHDPDSFDHVETQYWDMGSHLVVKTTYRGKNAFGAVVVNWIKAKVNPDSGEIIEFMENG